MEDDLFDWEILHGSDTESTDSSTSNEKSRSSSVIDDGMILSDHFSATELNQSSFIEPDDSSRVNYGLEPPVMVDLGDTCVRSKLGFYDSKIGVSGDGDEVKLSSFEADDVKNLESQSSVEEERIEDLSKSCSDSGGNKLVSGDSGIVNCEEEIVSSEQVGALRCGEEEIVSNEEVGALRCGEEEIVSSEEVGDVRCGEEEIVSNEEVGDVRCGEEDMVSIEEVGDVRCGDEEIVSSEEVGAVRCGDESETKSREIVWWKMPFVLIKYSVFKIGPVWSVSLAAAVMGLVILGRRLYNMKKKTRSFHLKVTIDDKKVSRVMSQAARLNEVFTEVRRVRVIRSALPSPVAWPVLSLR